MDFDYLMRRHEDEVARAAEAETESAREAHLALAHQYLRELERLRSQGPQLGLQAG